MGLAVLLAALSVAAAAPSGGTVAVGCAEAIDTTPFPYVGGRTADTRYRTLLGAVAVPPVSLPDLYRSGTPGWRYWRKAGIVIRAGRAVTLSVPPRWRHVLGIGWGGHGDAVPHTVRFPACGPAARRGRVYAGGFVVRSGPVCAPLEVRSGGRRAVAWFGLGVACPRARVGS